MKPELEPRRLDIGVVGDADLAPKHPRLGIAEAVGEGIVSAGHRLVTGGRGGVMAAASRGARHSPAWQPGSVVGLLPGRDAFDANPWVEVAIPTGLGHGRNLLVARASAVIAIGGGAGTLSEIAFAWIFDRLVIGLRCGGWSERLADTRVDDRPRFPSMAQDRVFGAADAAEALGVLDHWLPRYLELRRDVGT